MPRIKREALNQGPQPYPEDDSLPGSSDALMDRSEFGKSLRTIEDMLADDTYEDGTFFRLRGWPDGKVRRARLMHRYGKPHVLASWRKIPTLFQPCNCVEVILQQPSPR